MCRMGAALALGSDTAVAATRDIGTAVELYEKYSLYRGFYILPSSLGFYHHGGAAADVGSVHRPRLASQKTTFPDVIQPSLSGSSELQAVRP